MNTSVEYLMGLQPNQMGESPRINREVKVAEPKTESEIPPAGNALIWERNGSRLELPNTPETRTLFERLVLASLGNPSIATA